mmetsp:Transcript_72233/g.193182  ORF Transcript_72233/g.193182 Transcript_72233/m.193182 type:complete len:125 (+) Transcript_72233:505-879(+)
MASYVVRSRRLGWSMSGGAGRGGAGAVAVVENRAGRMQGVDGMVGAANIDVRRIRSKLEQEGMLSLSCMENKRFGELVQECWLTGKYSHSIILCALKSSKHRISRPEAKLLEVCLNPRGLCRSR